MNKEDFLKQFVLTRTSHKRIIEDLLQEGLFAWDFIQKNK